MFSVSKLDVIGYAPLTCGSHSKIVIRGAFLFKRNLLLSSIFLLPPSERHAGVNHFIFLMASKDCIHLFTQKPTSGICDTCWEQKLVCVVVLVVGYFSFLYF